MLMPQRVLARHLHTKHREAQKSRSLGIWIRMPCQEIYFSSAENSVLARHPWQQPRHLTTSQLTISQFSSLTWSKQFCSPRQEGFSAPSSEIPLWTCRHRRTCSMTEDENCRISLVYKEHLFAAETEAALFLQQFQPQPYRAWQLLLVPCILAHQSHSKGTASKQDPSQVRQGSDSMETMHAACELASSLFSSRSLSELRRKPSKPATTRWCRTVWASICSWTACSPCGKCMNALNHLISFAGCCHLLWCGVSGLILIHREKSIRWSQMTSHISILQTSRASRWSKVRCTTSILTVCRLAKLRPWSTLKPHGGNIVLAWGANIWFACCMLLCLR